MNAPITVIMYITTGTSSLLKKASSSSSSSSSARSAGSKLFSSISRPADSAFNRKVVADSIQAPCQNHRFSSFSSALRSVRCSVPRWSHGVDWKSPASLSAQIRTASPVFNGFYRKIATMGKNFVDSFDIYIYV